jgi:aldehyde dehydrogenase (NAD+)
MSLPFLDQLGIGELSLPICTGSVHSGDDSEGIQESFSPADGKLISTIGKAKHSDYEHVMTTAGEAFKHWRSVPAPARGEVVRQIGEKLREIKDPLGALVSYEMGKSLQEGLGEVQEMIDICDFAVGLSRQLYGLTMHSERPNHRMYEQWHPMGIVGIISAFNFPVAVWAWNTMIATVCGDVTVWKPSKKAPLTAIAIFNAIGEVLTDNDVPEGVMSYIIGPGAVVGESMINDPRIPLISATGSTRVGIRVAEACAKRLGKSILELGGNNAIIITPNADLKLTIPAVVFGSVGTAGQRCTSTRRLIIHDSMYDSVKDALIKAYTTVRIGTPLDEANHMGPLVDRGAVQDMQDAIAAAKQEGASVIYGGDVLGGEGFESGCYVEPCIIEAKNEMAIVQQETFAPILYLCKYSGELEDAMAQQNGVPQGLSSAIFTSNLLEAEEFLSTRGSDCGIANVNIGTSGAEIGGAFGGEKETGWGRESGSDSWRQYMRRQTNTINYGKELPLAQGIEFDV